MENNFWIIIIFVGLGLFVYFGWKRNSGSVNNQEAMETDARRFARLLVAEIKLSEDYKVERGLRNNNLYDSLQDEIESARKKYKKRILDKNQEKYFDDAVLEVLAGGDRSKLGIVYTSLEK